MSWLSGKPRRVISLLWPEHDPLLHQDELKPGTWSVLDDQVMCALVVREPNELFSAVYLAKIHEMATDKTTVAFVKITTLPHAVHRVALLPDRVGFASLEFNKDALSVTLRIHNFDGITSKEHTAPAAAAYGHLVVNRHAVAICISSGQPSPPDLYLSGSPDVYHRVDAWSDTVLPERRDLTGDNILVWTIDLDSLKCVRIPQDEEAPLTHQANFQFVGDSHIALGGRVLSAFGRPSALLKAFLVDNPDEFSRTFTHGDNFEMDDDIDVIAKPGSSGQNTVLGNYHHAGNRFTVVDNRLLSGDIDSEPSSEPGSDDPSGLHAFWDHPQFSRTLSGTINRLLPSISDNRLLVGHPIEFDEEGLKKFAVKAAYERNGTMLFFYDFDQVRCNELRGLTAAERTSLRSKLQEENANVQVSVIERNFYISIEEEEDREWSPGSKLPQEWRAHLRQLDEIGQSRKNGTAEVPVLEYDEAPDAQKGNPRLLFTRSAVWLPEDTELRAIEFNTLALTTSGIVHVPPAGKTGHFFCFADS